MAAILVMLGFSWPDLWNEIELLNPDEFTDKAGYWKAVENLEAAAMFAVGGRGGGSAIRARVEPTRFQVGPH